MGIGHSLYALYQMGRFVVPTVLDSKRGPIDRARLDQRIRARARSIVDGAGIRLEVQGGEKVRTDRACVYMSNHQSHLDIPVLFCALPPVTMRAVAKKELFRVPLFGTAMRAAGVVEVDRADRERAIASLQGAAAAIADGVSMWIAPEGTRSRTGELGRLKKGGFHLAIDTGAPIVPVAISGTRRALPAGGRSIRTGMPVRVVIGAPIETTGRDLQSLMDEVESFLAAHVDPDLSS